MAHASSLGLVLKKKKEEEEEETVKHTHTHTLGLSAFSCQKEFQYLRELFVTIIIKSRRSILDCHQENLWERRKKDIICFNDAKPNLKISSRWTPEVEVNTFIGGYFEKGAWPCANSSAVIPNDQISALYKDNVSYNQVMRLYDLSSM